MPNFVVISGCSSGGKSTLLAELAHRGYPIVPEPGLRIVNEQTTSQGQDLPWIDPVAFARRTLALAQTDVAATAPQLSWVFFDRGAVDAAAALEHLTGEPLQASLARTTRYHSKVFLAPPWPEIYINTPDRRHSYQDALAEYNRLLHAYSTLAYQLILLPKTTTPHRADFLLNTLSQNTLSQVKG
jgi:predicted ATPase